MLVSTSYKSFINEAFNLEKYYEFHKIPEFLQKFANDSLKHIEPDTVPSDLKNKMDSVKFWVAKSIKHDMLLNIDNIVRKTLNKNDVNIDFNILKQIFISLLKNEKIDDNYINALEVDDVSKKEIKNLVSHQHNIINVIKSDYDLSLNAIFDYFFSLARDTRKSLNLVNSTFRDMFKEQEEWHKELKEGGEIKDEKGRIIKKYPDGFYWIDTLTNSCQEEAHAMGHCGRTRANTILSLRQKTAFGIKPHATMAVDYESDSNKTQYGNIHQLKGKQNTKPISKYHPYIVDILIDDKLFPHPELDMDEYNSKEDFHIYDLIDEELIKKILDERYYLFVNVPLIGLSDEDILKLNKYSKKVKESTDQYNLIRFFILNIIDEKELISKLKISNENVKDLVVVDNKIYFTVKDYIDLLFMFGSTRDFDYELTYRLVMTAKLDELMYGQAETINEVKKYFEFINESNLKKIWNLLSDEPYKKTIINNANKLATFLNEIDDKIINKTIIKACNNSQYMADYEVAYNDCVDSVNEFFGVVNLEKNNKLYIPFDINWISNSINNHKYPSSLLKDYLEQWFDTNDKLTIKNVLEGGWNDNKVDEKVLNEFLDKALEDINKINKNINK